MPCLCTQMVGLRDTEVRDQLVINCDWARGVHCEIFAIFLFCAPICFGISVIFHCLIVYSEDVRK